MPIYYILLGKIRMLMEWADTLLSKMLECMELMGEGMDTPLTPKTNIVK